MNGVVIISCEDCGEKTAISQTEYAYLHTILDEIGWVNENGYWYCPKCTGCAEKGN